MHESTPDTPIRRAATALGSLPRPAAILAILAAAFLVGVVAVVPLRDPSVAGAGATPATGDEQRFALSSIAAAAEIADRDALASDLSPARQIEALIASRDQAAWARLVLYYGGWEISDAKVAAITQWMRAENSPESWWLRNNPLNNGWYTSTGNYFGSYASLDEAAYYAADSIRNRGLYPGIAAALGDPGAAASTVASAIINSGWATGFYGGGSHWHTGEVPAYTAPDGAWGR